MTASEIKTNLLCGFTVALALVPEAIAFAFVAHVNPGVGLMSAFIMCLVAATLGGRPGLISGATGAMSIVVVGLVVSHGVEYMFPAVVLAGLIQLGFAGAKLGKFIRLVPHPVMLGFVNGLQIVVILAQFNHFKTGPQEARVWLPAHELWIIGALVAATMAVTWIFPRITRAIPAALAGVLIVCAVTAVFGIHTLTLGDKASIQGGLPSFHLPQVPWTWETLRVIAPYSLTLAAAGLIESLLTLNLVDEITGTRGRPNKESFAQGTANVLCGLFGGMGGCVMVGQTMINVSGGARHRLAGIAAGVFLLCFILFASPLIERVPVAALVGVMFFVCLRTIEWSVLRDFKKVPRADMIVFGIVTAVTVLTDLAMAVGIGVVLAALVFAWEQAKHIRADIATDAGGAKVYRLHGPLFFASVTNFKELFSPESDPDEVVIDFAGSRVADHSALEAIDGLAEAYRSRGKHLHLRHLSADCRRVLERAADLVEVNITEDPVYPVADDKLA